MIARYERPAILDRILPDRHAIVEASAGTGKTFTLERIVLDRILGGTPIGAILVLTFTEKAATEMRERIRRLLRQIDSLPEGTNAHLPPERSWTIDGVARRRVREALATFDSASITTIHAFCNRILGEQAFANRRLFSEETVDSRSLFSRAFVDVLRSFAVDEEWGFLLRPWMAGRGLGALEDLLYEAWRAPGPVLPEVRPDELEAVRAVMSLFPLGDGTEGALVEAWEEVKRRTRSLKRIRTAIDRWREIRDILAGMPPEAGLRDWILVGWTILGLKKNNASYLETILGYLAEMVDPPEEVARLRRFCEELPRVLPPLEPLTVHVLLPRIAREVSRRKQAEGLLDFDDMLRVLHETLESEEGEALVRELRSRYRYAILDEFQDTDEIQWAIFRKLFFEGDGGNVLYAIGDPKQAIYGFRGADVGAYLRARREILAAGGAEVVLESCYRATWELIAAYNRVFEQHAKPPFFSGEIRYDHPVGCGRPELRMVRANGEAVAPVHVFELPEKTRGADAIRILATRAAEEILRLVRSPEAHVFWDEGGGPRRLRFADVFVLYRASSEGREIAEIFRARGIPFAFYKEEGLFQRPEAMAFLDLLRALEAPDDPQRRLRAWMSPFFAIRLRDLPQTRELPPDHPLVERIASWADDARQRRWERLFSRILDESGILRRAIACGDERALTNYLHLSEVLQERVHRHPSSCTELADWLQALIEKRAQPDRQNGNQQRLETDREAVKLMTLHAAKGLEAPVVFVLGRLTDPPRNSWLVRLRDAEGRRHYWAGDLDDAQQELVRREEREEAERLLYVGLTRAKGRLYLPYQDRPKQPVTWAPLLDRLGALRQEAPEGFVWEALADADEAHERAAATADAPIEIGEPEAVDEAVYAGLRERHLGFVITSYSRMRGFRGVEDEDEERIEGERMVIEPGQDELPGGTSTGIFLHDVLARVPFPEVPADFDAFCASETVGRIFAEAARAHGIADEHLPHARRLVWAGLTTPLVFEPLRLEGGVARADRWRSEMEFLYPLPGERERGFVKGFVDLVFEAGGRVYFADWKSDCLPSFDTDYVRKYVQSSYEIQLRLYAIAIRKLFRLETEAEFDERFGGAFYFFLRGMERGAGIYFERPSFAELLRWERELEGRA